MKNPPPMVEVVWRDHADADGPPWMTKVQAAKQRAAVCTTIGFLIGEDDEVMRVSSTWMKDSDYYAKPTLILQSAVVEWRYIES